MSGEVSDVERAGIFMLITYIIHIKTLNKVYKIGLNILKNNIY